jgi:hypothetical protein
LVEQETKKSRKKKEEEKEKLAFEIGEVFSPDKAKKEDFELDQESASYRARKGEAGDRKQIGSG